jgi:hypothetical protein
VWNVWETRGERKDRGFFVNKTRQIGVGMTTNNTGRGRGRERVEYRGTIGRWAHIHARRN